MSKDRLVNIVHKKTKVDEVTTRIVIETFLSSLREAMVNGETVRFNKFCTFGYRIKPKKLVRNPKTNEAFWLEAHARPRFTPSKTLIRDIKDKVKVN